MKLSHRYISGRQLPDKSVSVLDTACARVAIGQARDPARDRRRHAARFENSTVEIGVLEREAVTGADHDKRIEELKAAALGEEEKLRNLNAQWEMEKEFIARIREIRAQLEEQARNRKEAAGAQRLIGGSGCRRIRYA